jgi:hypothetical protein
MAKKDFNALNKQIAELRKVRPAAAHVALLLCQRPGGVLQCLPAQTIQQWHTAGWFCNR